MTLQAPHQWKVLAGLRQLVKLVAQDLALSQATWPTRYQTGVSRVIYNFAHEIIGLKNHWDYKRVNLFYPGDKGLSLGQREQQQLPLISRRVHIAVGHFVSL